jgi:hypothetical protein
MENLKKYFNFSEPQKCDPFLITTSLQHRNQLAVGSGIRAINKKKAPQPEKILIPLQDSIINKAKACEEVILFERGELI